MLKRALNILLVIVVGALVGLAPTQQASALEPTVYNTPGDHFVNGRYWHTDCQMYSSQIVRCSTQIWGTKIVSHGGKYYQHEGWVQNNLTYLPSPRSLWATNPLGKTGTWTTSDGAKWRTECDTPVTGTNNCRNYRQSSVVTLEGGKFVNRTVEVLNSMVQFSTSSVPHQNTVPAAAAPISGVPVEQPFAPPVAASQYTQPGYHLVSGRWFKTACEKYSAEVVRCRTEIWGTKVVTYAGKLYNHTGWVFNNLTYLPSPRALWVTNNLGRNATWTTSDGRQWKTECDTATTGANNCRTMAMTTVTSVNNGVVSKTNKWVLNNIVMFSSASVGHTKSVPAASTTTGYPVEKTFTPPAVATFRTDSRCMTGRVMCISKEQRKMAWMINGQIIKMFDVRFGSTATPTRNGAFSVYWKSRNHTSSLYDSWMPFAMFFSGGQAVHYSPDFARNGYSGASHGCVNVRDYNGIVWLFDTQVRVGDKVIVYN